MKKLFLLLLVFPFIFGGCSDDDDDDIQLGAEPYFNSSYTRSQVKAKEKRDLMDEGYGKNGDYMILYEGETKDLEAVVYMFDPDFDFYLYAAVMLYSEASYSTLINHYKGKYGHEEIVGNISLFYSESVECFIGVSISEEGYVGVAYLDYAYFDYIYGDDEDDDDIDIGLELRSASAKSKISEQARKCMSKAMQQLKK